jgi:hypothetical protein
MGGRKKEPEKIKQKEESRKTRKGETRKDRRKKYKRKRKKGKQKERNSTCACTPLPMQAIQPSPVALDLTRDTNFACCVTVTFQRHS